MAAYVSLEICPPQVPGNEKWPEMASTEGEIGKTALRQVWWKW